TRCHGVKLLKISSRSRSAFFSRVASSAAKSMPFSAVNSCSSLMRFSSSTRGRSHSNTPLTTHKRPLSLVQAQDARQGGPQVLAGHDGVYHAVLQGKLRRLKPCRQRLANRPLHD